MEKYDDLLLIFDLDGTIFRTKETIFPAVRDLMRDMGYGGDSEDLVESLIGEKTSDFCEIIKPDDIGMEEFIDKLWEKEKEFIDKKGTLYEGIRDVLEELRSRGVELVLCSNGNRDYIEYILDNFGLKEYFSLIKSSSEFEDKSDAVEDILTCFDKKQGMLVGDRYTDKNAAENNNIIFLAALYGYGRSEIEEEYFTINEPVEILERIPLIKIFMTIEKDYTGLSKEKIKVIGVNGIDNSGKTTFTRSLSMYFISRGYNTEVLSIDDFHNPKRIRRKGKNPVEAYYNNAFNTELLIDEILEPLSKNEEIHKELKLLNLSEDIYNIKKEINIDKNDIVIIEGVLLYKKPLGKYIDYKIYLNIDYETMINRAEKRDKDRFNNDVVKRYKEKYLPIQKKYINENNPKMKSDIVIDYNDFEKPSIKKI